MKTALILCFLLLITTACKTDGGNSSSDSGGGGLCGLSGGGANCPPQSSNPETPFSMAYMDPPNGTSDFGADETITIELNRAVSISSLIYNSGTPSLDNIVLKDELGEDVLLEVSTTGELLKIKPMFSLSPGRRYTLTLKPTITDTNAKNLDQQLTSTFTVAGTRGTNPGTQPMLSWSNEANTNSGVAVDRFELQYGQTQRTGNSNFSQYERTISIPTSQAALDPNTGRYTFELNEPVESNRMYYFSMKACNAAGCSDYSPEASKLQP